MARAPRATVSKTSGSGVSRLAYHRAYNLRRGDAPKVKFDAPEAPSGERQYAKTKTSKAKKAGGMNISYGSTIHPSTIEDVENYGRKGK